MRLTLGSWILDSTPASSTVTTAALRLDYELPFIPKVTGNEMRVPAVRVYVEAANEAGLKTAVEAIEEQFRQVDGKTVTFFNTTGTAIFILDPSLWPRIAIEHSVDYSDNNAKIVFDIVAQRPEPVTGGEGDETGQRGEIEWQLEIGPNGLTGAVATAEFGPEGGASAMDNAAVWVNKFYTSPPTGLPAWMSTRLRPVHAMPVATQKPNQATITEDSYDPFAVEVLFREVYSGLETIPTLTTDVVVNSTMINEEAMDVRSGETDGPALITLSGYFTLITEAPTEFRTSSATALGRAEIYGKAISVYEAIEADFKAVHTRFGLKPLGDVVIDPGMDSGKITFARTFSTTKIRKWKENTWIENTDHKLFNRDYKGRVNVHHGQGKPDITLVHELEVDSLEAPRPYSPPSLTQGWERTSKGQAVTVEAKLRGGTIIYTTKGRTSWRYADSSGGGTSESTQAGGGIITHATIGTGRL